MLWAIWEKILTEAIAIHSFKGGSGKTLVSMNLATYLVLKGKRVALIDLDLTAPSLQTYAPNRNEKKINDYLLYDTNPEEIFFDATYLLNQETTGKLFMGLADISGEAIAKINQRDTDAMLNDLFLLMELVRNKLPADPWNVDYIIIDSSPGLTTQSINGVAITDHVIMVLRLISSDAGGTTQFLQTLHKSVQPKTSIVVNQIPEKLLYDGDGRQKIEGLVSNAIVNNLQGQSVNFGGVLLMDEGVIANEFNYALSIQHNTNYPRPIHLTSGNVRFSDNFTQIMDRIIGE